MVTEGTFVVLDAGDDKRVVCVKAKDRARVAKKWICLAPLLGHPFGTTFHSEPPAPRTACPHRAAAGLRRPAARCRSHDAWGCSDRHGAQRAEPRRAAAGAGAQQRHPGGRRHEPGAGEEGAGGWDELFSAGDAMA